jgi:hypothetical protein
VRTILLVQNRVEDRRNCEQLFARSPRSLSYSDAVLDILYVIISIQLMLAVLIIYLRYKHNMYK